MPESPTPPMPRIATVSPGRMRAVLITAPDTGHDGAAEQRRIGERHVLVDHDTLPRSTTTYSDMQESPE